ncbi:N-6 DNA methylase [Clostridium beijerinckii]|uniref:site-specific DNA-methyltransferase (adenine-specific) n=1 Tax=Clostridium beijerinckii TaxID=1520 RepID=A0A1S8S3L0_CLOBE|nr:N-6 DNA methylase [Clostridium beijerinckii]NRY60646.1 putative RNA methylase [Clostridium beijerinckii]OOM60046.1 putative type I restriction enzymeP M protein [Clostridium beijerinckii]
MDKKKELLNNIKKSLNKIGYDNKKIIDKYPITTKDENVIYFDFIAFGNDKIQDTSTSCISVQYCEDEKEEEKIVEDAKYSAAPLLIVSMKEKVRLWKLNVEKKSEKIIELKYDQLGDHFSENRVRYDYSKIISSKNEVEQLNFFNTNNLFQFASKINCELLGKEFKKAISAVKDLVDKDNSRQKDDVTSIIMHIIAAKILNDKLMLKKRFSDIHKLLDELSRKYGDYFNKEQLYKYGIQLIDTIENSFNSNLLYRGIDNKILGNFYESTLFESDENKNKKLKREWGIYYTPSCIVSNMLKSMPIELIDYRRRYVLDGSCGSGSLLIGAYRRLKELLPAKMDEEVQHKYLTDMIFGIDIDKFACEVARLELLLNSIPYGNGWNIKSEDFLKINNMTFKPNIIIANPPYEEKRKETLTEKASIFLEKYIDILEDEGLLGIVLPQTFLSNRSSTEARKKLLENIQLYEVWHLPKGVFDTNNCATTVIIGRKQRVIEDKAFKGRIVVQKSVDRFKNTSKFDFEFICEPQNVFLGKEDYSIIISPIQNILNKLRSNNNLKKYVDYTRGIEFPYDKYPLISDYYKEGYSKFYRNAKLGMKKYKINWYEQKKSKYIRYAPESKENKEFIAMGEKGVRLREEKRYILESQKVVVARNSTPGTFWRIKAAIDHEKLYPSHSLWCFISKDETVTLEVIAAVLNSKIANLFIEKENLEMNLVVNNLLKIPFPDLTSKQKEFITKFVKEIENGINIEQNMNSIDYILYEAFNLDDNDIKIIESYYCAFTENNFELKEYRPSDTVQLTGEVKKIDLEKKIIKASFVECDEEKIIKINNEIPGWMMVENAPFICRILEDDFYEDEVNIMNVSPLQYTYLDDSEHDNLLFNKFNDYKSYKQELEFHMVKEEAQ